MRAEHGAGADPRARHLGHGGDRVEGAGGAQRDLEHRQPAGHQRAGKGRGMGQIVDHQDRDHRRQLAQVSGGVAMQGGGHRQPRTAF